MAVATPKQVSRGTRTDPRPSRVEAVGAFQVTLANQDPNMKYVWVSKTAKLLGIDYYGALNYEVVKYTEHGVRPMGSRRQRKASDVTKLMGHPIEYMDAVLMAVEVTEHADIERNGADGDSGQALADRIEHQIIDRESVARDTLRGIGGFSRHGAKYFDLDVQSQPLERE